MGAKVKSSKNHNNWEDDYLKAAKKGEREARKEIFGDGFKSNTKIHSTLKGYSRKGKHKFSQFNSEDDDI